MEITLDERTSAHVRIYFERVQDAEIQKYLPRSVSSVQQALENFEHARKPGATSYGRVILVDGNYVGDVWCYGINLSEIPQAMISFCLFEKKYRGNGVMSRALALFLSEISQCYGISCFGAFSFSENSASIRVLEKNGFFIQESFSENGIESVYMQTEDAE